MFDSILQKLTMTLTDWVDVRVERQGKAILNQRKHLILCFSCRAVRLVQAFANLYVVCSLNGAHFKTALWNGYQFIVACTKDGNNRDVFIAIYICNVVNTVNMAILKGMKVDAGVEEWLEQKTSFCPWTELNALKLPFTYNCLMP